MRERFRWLDKAVERFGYWAGAYLALSTLFTWIGKQLKAMQPYGWPEAVLVGVGAATVVLVVCSFALVALRYFRGDAPRQSTPAARPSNITVTDVQISDVVKAMVSAGKASEERDQALKNRTDHLASLIQSLADRVTAIDAPNGMLGGSLRDHIDSKTDAMMAVLQESIAGVKVEVKVLFSYCVHIMKIELISHLLRTAPYTLDDLGTMGESSKEKREAIDQFIRRVERKTANTQWAANISQALQEGQAKAETYVRETPSDERTGDPYDYRISAIAQFKYGCLLRVLKHSKGELQDDLQTYGPLLTERMQSQRSVR